MNDLQRNKSQLSLPLMVSFESPPCSSSSSSLSSNSTGCVMKMNLQNKLPSQFSSLPPFQSQSQSQLQSRINSNSESDLDSSPSFEVDCVLGEEKDHEFTCPSGDLLVISCNGSFSGKGYRLCPLRSSVVSCEASVQSSSSISSVDVGEISCEVSQESNESMTICVCELSKVVVGDSGSVSFSILSIQKSVVTDFVATWKSTSSLSSSDVADSWVVLVTVGGLGLVFLLLVLMSYQFDSSEKKKILIETTLNNNLNLLSHQSGNVSGNIVERRANRGTMTTTPSEMLCLGVEESSNQSQSHPNNNNNQRQSQGEVSVKEDMKLIEESLPSIFKSDSLWIKFKEEMKVYHRWLGIVFFYSPVFPRSMRVLSLFSSIVIMLFVQSVTYNIADADDGSCESCEDESCCLSLKSTLNSNEDRCYWESSGIFITNLTSPSLSSLSSEVEFEGSCHYREIENDMVRMFIVAMISAIVSAPFALSIQYLIMNVLSKESINQHDESQNKLDSHKTRMERLTTKRRINVSPVSSSPTELDESCGRDLQDDLNNILKELCNYYSEMMKNENNNNKDNDNDDKKKKNKITIKQIRGE